MKQLKKGLIFIIVCLLCGVQTVFAQQLLVPGGQVIGLELGDETVTVAAFDDVLGQGAKAAGLQIGDRITGINGNVIHTAEDVKNALKKSDGQAQISVLRQDKPLKLTVNPEITPDGPKLGVYLKQGITGVGTVSWYDPESGAFGALGHGVNDAKGALVEMTEGTVYDATVIAIRQGKSGSPGQLMSSVAGGGVIGSIEKNTVQGVFGSAKLKEDGEKLPVGKAEQVHAGPAMIRSTISGKGVQEYSVEIMKVYPHSGADGRNMLIKVTDPELLSATGGIVQGMSGSPIIQDGKLVGAVTHVLVNDPKTGYGIFIENMLDAAA